jgi:arylsulfatase A-like enzyme
VTLDRVGLALGLAALLACGRGEPEPPLRFVLVTIDTLRADHLGCYGAAGVETPTLDRLATEAVRFETAISPAPLTLPSHASLLTGLEPPRHGIHNNAHFRLPADGPATLAERFRDGGFATAAFVGSFVLDRRFGLTRGFDVYDDQMALSDTRSLAPPERRADAVVDAASAWLASAPERFLLWVHFYDPHADYAPPPPFDARFRHDPYTGEIAFADAQLGRLLAALATRFPDGRTALVVTSDHGESRGEHGEQTHAYTVYDATQRVPLLLRAPGVAPGVHAGLVRLVDVAPTLLELAGLPALPGAGESLLSALSPGSAPRSAFVETFAPRMDLDWSPLFGLRTAERKYIRAPRPELYDLASDPRELRDLSAERPDEVAALDRELEARLAGAPPIVPNLSLDAGDRARLEALGYVTETQVVSEVPGRVTGVDPKDGLRDFARLAGVQDLIAAGRGEEALAVLAPFAGREAEWIQTLRASAALAAGRGDLALEAGEALVAHKPFAAGGHVVVASALELLGRLDDAEAAHRALTGSHPEMGHAYTGLGRIAEARGRPEEAAGHYRAALAARVPDAEAAWRLGALLLEQGQVEAAGLVLAPLSGTALRWRFAALRLALAERAAGRLDMALLRADAGLREAPDFAPLLELKGDLLERQGDLVAALELRERMLAQEPGNPVLQNQVAWSLALLGRNLDRALALAQAAARALPEEPEAQDTLAAVRLARGEAAAALAPIEAGLARAQGDTRTGLLLRRAEARARLGRHDAARADLAAALGGREPGALSAPLRPLAERAQRLASGAN